MWTVLAPSTDVGKGALAGTYARRATASVSAGAGVGGNVLVGGGEIDLAAASQHRRPSRPQRRRRHRRAIALKAE